jgi:hypothetical protein
MVLVALECGDTPESWAALGFRVVDGRTRVGTVDVLLDGGGGGLRGWQLGPEPRDAEPGERDLDHVVLLTATLDETVDDLVAQGGDLRRRRDDLHSPMAFVRFGPSIVEVVQTEGPTRLWGLVAVVDDFSELPADLVGEPRDAVQPGRRIVTVRREAGLGTALAFMTPRA